MIDVYKGDSSEIVTVRPAIADDAEIISNNWTCKSWVTDKYGNVIIAERSETSKTSDDLNYAVSLSAADTDLLTVEGSLTEYVWVIEVANATLSPAYIREQHLTIAVRN